MSRRSRISILAGLACAPGISALPLDARWIEGGVPVCALQYSQVRPKIVTDGAGGAIIAWEDTRGGDYTDDVYAQRLSASGAVLWGSNGVAVCTSASTQRNVDLLSYDSGGAIVVWDDYRNGTDNDIYAALLDGNGALVQALVSRYQAVCSGSAITVKWELTEFVAPDRFLISRSEGSDRAGTWTTLSTPAEVGGLAYSCTDFTCAPGTTCRYRVAVEEDGTARMLFETEPVTIPALGFALNQNHPNPFNPSTTISFSLPRECEVTLEVYDGAGRSVATILQGERLPAGSHEAKWNGRGARGKAVASGVYFSRLTAGKLMQSRKMILVR